MNRVAKLMLFACMLMAMSAQAESLKCIGQDAAGNTINVILDKESGTVNVNGNILKIVSETEDKKGISSEDFKTDTKTVYVSLVPDGDNLILHEFDAKTNNLDQTVNLACHE